MSTRNFSVYFLRTRTRLHNPSTTIPIRKLTLTWQSHLTADPVHILQITPVMLLSIPTLQSRTPCCTELSFLFGAVWL